MEETPRVPSSAALVPVAVAATPAGPAPGTRRLWQCVYPGCHEAPKTHYNCDSHVWDAHIRHQLPPEHPLAHLPYKRLPDRRAVKPLCSAYVVPLPDTVPPPPLRRPRQPYPDDQSHVLPAPSTATTTTTTTTTTTLPQQQPQEALGEVRVVDGVRCEEPAYALDARDVVRIVHMSPELARLHVCGEVFAERGFLQRSDARFKADIAPIRGALDRVLRLSGRTFRYRGDGAARMGFVAQELEAVVPTAVRRDAHGLLSVDVASLVPLLLEALKDLHAQTLRSESARAQSLRAALADAVAQVDALNRKFDAYRESCTSAATTASSNGNHSFVALGDDGADNNNDYQDGNNDFDDNDYDDYDDGDGGDDAGAGESDIEMDFAGDKGPGRRGRGTNSSSSSSSRRGAGVGAGAKDAALHYRFSFGPAVPVLLLGIVLVGGGFAACLLLPTLPFVWGYAWALGAALLLSLLGQAGELRAVVRGHEVPLYWTHANSINWLGAATVALLGATLTLVLGTDSLVVCRILSLHPPPPPLLLTHALSCMHTSLAHSSQGSLRCCSWRCGSSRP